MSSCNTFWSHAWCAPHTSGDSTVPPFSEVTSTPQSRWWLLHVLTHWSEFYSSSNSNEITAAQTVRDQRMPGDFTQDVLVPVLLQLHCCWRQPGYVRACRATTRHCCIWICQDRKLWLSTSFCSCCAPAFCTGKPGPSAVVFQNAWDARAISPAWSTEKITFVSAHVERMAPHSDVVKPVVQEGPKTWRWYTCQKPSQSSMRTFCLSRHIKQAQINQLWPCKIFLIQAFRWLSSIGKSLNSKKGQKAILLHCLLRTTQALSYTFPACTSEVVRALAWFTAQNAK